MALTRQGHLSLQQVRPDSCKTIFIQNHCRHLDLLSDFFHQKDEMEYCNLQLKSFGYANQALIKKSKLCIEPKVKEIDE